jgi:hypothetical protein
MAKLVTAAQKIERARELIQQAREVPIPQRGGKYDLSYMAEVKGLLRQARDLVKLIPLTAGATPENKAQAKKVIEETEQANHEIFRG